MKISSKLPLFLASALVVGCTSRPFPLSVEPRSPFTLDITDERYDGQALHVHATLKSAVQWDPKRVALRLAALNEGETVAHTLRPVADLISHGAGAFPADEPTQLALSLPAAHLTDYQLELLWGDEAAPYLKHTAPPTDAPVPPAELQNVRFDLRRTESCRSEPCPYSYVVEAEVVNRGIEPLDHVKIGVGFLWLPTGAAQSLVGLIPEREQEVDLSDLSLAPGQARPLRLVFARPLRRSEEGEYVPHVRILESSVAAPDALGDRTEVSRN